jgi:hypothetical protein
MFDPDRKGFGSSPSLPSTSLSFLSISLSISLSLMIILKKIIEERE